MRCSCARDIAPVCAVNAAPTPVAEYISHAAVGDTAPAVVFEYITPVEFVAAGPVNEYLVPVPSVDAAQAPVVESFMPMSVGIAAPELVDEYVAAVPAAHAVYAAPTPVVGYISPAPFGYSAPAPVGEYMASAIETAVVKVSLDRDIGVPDRLQSFESLVVAASKSVTRQRRSVASVVRDEPAWLTTVPERSQSIESSIRFVRVCISPTGASRGRKSNCC